MAFAVVESESPTGLGQLFKDTEGTEAYKLLQTFNDYGVTSQITVRNNFGQKLFEWSVVWSSDTTRRQGKDIIRTLLNHVERTENYEMFVCSVWESEKHVAFDLDDSFENGKIKINEFMKRWRIIKSYNYRAPDAIKYDEIRECLQTCNEDYRENTFFGKLKEWLKNI